MQTDDGTHRLDSTPNPRSLVDRIVGVGSPHGDDQVGWLLIEQLRHDPQLKAETRAVRNAVGLTDHLDGCRRLIIVDACRSGAPPGTITRFEWPDARIQLRHGTSTHGLGVADTLRLTEKLGRLPPRVVLFGIEVGECRPAADVDGELAGVLAGLARQIAAEVMHSVDSVGAGGGSFP